MGRDQHVRPIRCVEETDKRTRIEASVIVEKPAHKKIVIGKQGLVSGDIMTQDAVISGRVEGTLVAASRLEVQATSHIEGEVHTRRMQLEEGAVLNGTIHMGSDVAKAAATRPTGEAGSAVRTGTATPEVTGAAR